MYPTISHLLNDLFGFYIPLPIQTFGFFVAIAFLCANYFFAKELKRKEAQGLLSVTLTRELKGKAATPAELFISGLIGFIIGFKLLDIIFHYHDFVDNPQGFILSYRGSYLGAVLGAAGFAYLKYSEKKKEQKDVPYEETITMRPYEHVGNMTMIAAISGLLGAKIFHNLENINEFIADPVGALFSFSGLTMYGGLIVGSAAVIYYAKKNGLTVTHVIDACAPGLMLAYGVGRLGCHLSGDGDWGIENLAPQPAALSFLPDWFWSFSYPHNVLNEGIPIAGCVGKHCSMLPNPVFPTALYEAITCIGLFFVLWGVRKKITSPGVLFSLYLLLNGLERFFIEKIRVNTLYHIFGYGITQAEIISFCLIILGIIGIFYFKKRHAAMPDVIKAN